MLVVNPEFVLALQASGEAQYTNDIPVQEGELYAAFVYGTQVRCIVFIFNLL